MYEHLTVRCEDSEVRKILLHYEAQRWELVSAVALTQVGIVSGIAELRLFFKRPTKVDTKA